MSAAEHPAGVAELAEQARDDVSARDKRIVNLKAYLALAGHELHIIDAGHGTPGYLIIWPRGGQSRTLPDLAAVHRFAEMVTGKKL